MSYSRLYHLSPFFQGPDGLAVSNLPDVQPAPDQYLIAVHAAAANFFDILQIQGKYQNQPPFPWVAGAEFAGVVLATPTGSQLVKPRFAVGDRVFGASQGAYATKVCATESQLCPVPTGWSFSEAAGLFVTAPTSYAALVIRANIRAGDYVLVHAAAGGVGLAAVQVAKAFGATVIATAGTARKLAVAQAFGADHVIDYKAEANWPDAVRKLTPNGRGVDIVFDPVGLVDRSTKCTAWNGRILIVGFAAGKIEAVAMNKVLLKNISLVGIHWGAYTRNEPDQIPAVWEGLRWLIDRGAFRPTVFTDGEPFVGLDHVPATLKALGGRETWGKVVVEIPQEAESKL
ncbi:alcohol dehydrogenase [Grosmannia clavigera kw1407]|uniref:Alcohol dehydrogenase n=1 Tax=Grosmannia clavigera (strain kw1407 / UAMH 11150) TaxID=655863 RepID=F0XDQ1_GROCL|nr:alcohol dehydrogenase [Grosmannia clavigera kw1407]EFX04025.1 alcohol dehydrogenase [Grosmannia clavigera kw1407]